MHVSRRQLAISITAAVAALSTAAGCGGSGGSSGPTKLSAQEAIARAKPATVELWGKVGEDVLGGSGVVYNAKRGLIITNAHVVEGMSGLQAKVGDKLPPVPAQIVGTSPCDDLAVVRLTRIPPGLKALPLGNSDKAKNGERVVVLGYPASFQRAIQQTVSSTEGTISNPSVIGNQISTDLPKYPALIQHQAPINHGNSGGPLVDPYGQVIGINTLTSAPIGNQGQYYSIAINQAKSVLPQLQSGHSPTDVGWRLEPMKLEDVRSIATDLVAHYDLQDVRGAIRLANTILNNVDGLYVIDTPLGSPAHDAEIFHGDVITSINGTNVSTVPQVCKILESASPGSTLAVDTEIIASGKQLNDVGGTLTEQLKLPRG